MRRQDQQDPPATRATAESFGLLVQAVNHFVQVVSYGRHRTFWRNVADTYDWHCCPYRTFHTEEELHRVLADMGLVDVTITNPTYRGAINIVGRRPPATGAAQSGADDARLVSCAC